MKARWVDEHLNKEGCFAWGTDWQMAPTHKIAGRMELYEKLLPTKLYSLFKTRTTEIDNCCWLCGKAPESLPHVLAGCSILAWNKYLARHNAVLQVLFFEMLRELRLPVRTPPRYLPVAPKQNTSLRRLRRFVTSHSSPQSRTLTCSRTK